MGEPCILGGQGFDRKAIQCPAARKHFAFRRDIQVVWGGFQHLSSKVVRIDGIDDSEFTRHLLLTSPCYFPEHPSGSSRLQSSCARAASESPRGLEVSFVTVSPQLGTYLTSCRYPEIFTRSQ